MSAIYTSVENVRFPSHGACGPNLLAAATCSTPKTCSVCAATEGETLVAYFTEYGLDAKLLDKSGEYGLPVACYQDESKTTIATVTIEDYKTIASDKTHEALDGYEWKILSIKMHFDDENAWYYGFKGFNYLWCGKYVCEPADDDEDTGLLFGNGIVQSFVWNGVEYTDGLLRIEESITEWLKDETGANYIDVFATVSVRVPVGYDGFVFGLETTGWEWADGTYLHEVITDNTLLFCLD